MVLRAENPVQTVLCKIGRVAPSVVANFENGLAQQQTDPQQIRPEEGIARLGRQQYFAYITVYQ